MHRPHFREVVNGLSWRIGVLMKSRSLKTSLLLVSMLLPLTFAGCNGHVDAAAEAPPPANVVPAVDVSLFTVDRPEQFPLAAATEHPTVSELVVTGTVTPDVSRQVPVPSLATGRIMEIDARLGDQVTKGQLLFKVRSTDIAGAYSTYRQAVKNEQLAVDNERLSKIQLNRAKVLFENGAVPKSGLETAENAEIGTQTELENAKIVTETA